MTTPAGVQKYTYDANGNQLSRIVGGETYILTYDAENRLSEAAQVASLRIQLFNYMNSGWVAFDDVSQVKVGKTSLPQRS